MVGSLRMVKLLGLCSGGLPSESRHELSYFGRISMRVWSAFGRRAGGIARLNPNGILAIQNYAFEVQHAVDKVGRFIDWCTRQLSRPYKNLWLANVWLW